MVSDTLGLVRMICKRIYLLRREPRSCGNLSANVYTALKWIMGGHTTFFVGEVCKILAIVFPSFHGLILGLFGWLSGH